MIHDTNKLQVKQVLIGLHSSIEVLADILQASDAIRVDVKNVMDQRLRVIKGQIDKLSTEEA